MMTFIRRMFRNKKKRRALKSIRSTFAVIGYDVSGLTDEELQELLVEVSRPISHIGYSTEQLLSALTSLSLAKREC